MITMSRLGRDGQLGNQLFQYAMLRAVALCNNYEMGIPKTFDGVKMNGMVELEKFLIEAPELKPEQAAKVAPNKFKYERVKFNPEVLKQPDGTDFAGWYQSHYYFKDIEATIRREFRFTPDIDQPIDTFVKTLRAGRESTPLVSLHVRRGDYLKHPDKFRVLGASYYRSAIYRMQLEIGHKQLVVLVFSDDMEWCKTQFQSDDKLTYVFVSNPTHWHDMCAMSKCDNHIIAASSFSWWGAWLNPNDDKVVIVPSPWFNTGLPEDTTDLIPEEWLQLETLEGHV